MAMLALKSDEALVERIDRVVIDMSAKTRIRLNRSDIMRSALERGLEQLEAELGGEPEKAKKAKR